MIRALRLPANPDKKVDLVELNPTDADAYRAIVVGPFDRRTYERSVPRYYRNAVFHEGRVTIEYRRRLSRRWVIPSITFNDWRQAYQYGAEFMHQSTDVTELRVMPL